MRDDITKRKEEICTWISENKSKRFICLQLDCKPETLNRYLDILGITYSGNKSGKGIKTSSFKKSALEYSKGTCVKSHILKLKLLEFGDREHKCEVCLNTTWLGKPIPLELHHVDGDHYNNKLENVQLICPNCHSQCPNNSGAASKK